MLVQLKQRDHKSLDNACADSGSLLHEQRDRQTTRLVNDQLMLHLRQCYYKPSKDSRLLAILDALSQENDVSQCELGRRLGVSSAMINQYLRDLQEKKLIVFEARNGKSYRYLLTPAGETRRGEMFAQYSSETIQIYTGLKNCIAQKMSRVQARGLSRLVLFGASETCEVVLSTLSTLPFKIVALLDNDIAKQGTLFHGHVVCPPQILDTVSCDAVLITSFGRQNEIYEQLAPLCATRGLEIVRL